MPIKNSMIKIIKRPYIPFLLAILPVMLLGYLSREAVLDINIHDTYVIINYGYLALWISVLFAIIGISYWAMTKANKKLATRLSAIHLILTFGGSLMLWILPYFYSLDAFAYAFNNDLTTAITLSVLVTLIGQILFPINIVYGLLRK